MTCTCNDCYAPGYVSIILDGKSTNSFVKLYTYRDGTDDGLKLGDRVESPTRYSTLKGTVVRVDVPPPDPAKGYTKTITKRIGSRVGRDAYDALTTPTPGPSIKEAIIRLRAEVTTLAAIVGKHERQHHCSG